MKQSPFSTSDSEANISETSDKLQLILAEQLDRRAPFAQTEIARDVTTGAIFDIPYTELTPEEGEKVYVLLLDSSGDVRVWRDATAVQPLGAVRLAASAVVTADFLLYLLRP